jgi:beta-glucosidase
MDILPYRDSSLPTAERVEDLLGRMSVPEKVGQLLQLDGRYDYRRAIEELHVGSLFHLNGSEADAAIDAALGTRLGIPLLLADDGIHGHSFWAGATIFPSQLAMACSWDPGLLEAVARVTAAEMRATGIKWTFSPVLCLARDLRWGRIDETFGEDPYLIGELAKAMIAGYQGAGLGDPEAVLATAKHYAGYSETLGGRDASEADLTRRKLSSYFLPPFEAAARSGCMAFMTGYQSIDGQPSTMNHWLLTEKLKGEWGFEGILVTDYNNVGTLVTDQRVCADYAEAAAVAIAAGNDMLMATPEAFEGCQEALRRGLLSEAELDATVARVLSLKFRMGLFEDPGRSDKDRITRVIGCPDHRAVNLRAARESLVLLKNSRPGGAGGDAAGGEPASGRPARLLPLDPAKRRKLAVVGPNADAPLAQLGDWSLGSGQMTSPSGAAHPRSSIVTILDGIKAALPPGWTLARPEEADIVLLVVGDNLGYIGEGKSTATLELQDGQIELADRVAALGKSTIVALVNSKPLVLPASILGADAILECFNPGMMGGAALAEAIFGGLNPSGKLTISVPFHVGQQPVYYNQARGQHGDRYADLTQESAFAFGFGLSYSRFEYGESRLASDRLTLGDTLRLSVEIRNSSDRDGVEIAQLYIEDEVTSLTWASRELCAFSRVELASGESKRVEFALPVSELWIVDGEGRRLVEPGFFRALVGSSSRTADLRALRFKVE